jgi:phosphoserine phosphatase
MQCQSAVVARDKKATCRKAAAGKGAGKAKPRKVAPPVGQNVLHAIMLKRIAALEKTMAKLPTSSSEEIEEVKNEIAKLRALPLVPTRLPTDAVQAQAKLRKNGEQILSSLATQVVSASLKVAVKERWASYGHELIATAQSVGEWIANSTTPF